MHKNPIFLLWIPVLAELNLVNAFSLRVVIFLNNLNSAYDGAHTLTHDRFMPLSVKMPLHFLRKILQVLQRPKAVFSDPCSIQSVESESCEIHITSTHVDQVWLISRLRVSCYVWLLILH